MKKILFILLAVCTYLPGWADVSPVPEIQFNFIYNTENTPLIVPQGSELFECKDRVCSNPEPLGVYGVQKLTCGPGTCQALAYDFDPFARLTVVFEDGITRTSNIFAVPNALVTKLNVYVDARKLTVEAVDTPPHEDLWKRPQVWGALILILILELACAAAFIFYQQKRFTILYGVAIANILTTAAVWLFLVHYVSQNAVLWIFCVLAEAGIIRLINHKDITFKEAGMLSIMMNVTSYTLGMIISFILA